MRPAKMLDDNAVKRARGALCDPEEGGATTADRGAAVDAWPASMDRVAFHGLPGRIVDAIDPHTEADPVAVLVQILVAFGSAVGRTLHFEVESTRHYGSLNVVLVGQTAKGRKGTSWEHVQRLFAQVDEGWVGSRVVSGLSSGEGLIWAVRDPIHKKEPVKEKGRVTGYDDVMIDEGVTDKRLMVMQPEFAHVLKAATREGNTLSATIRQAWDSGNLRVLTKNAPAVATGAHISMIGHITGDELLRYLEQTEAANGFANRYIWICVRRSKLLPEGGGFAGIDVRGFVAELRDAIQAARRRGDVPIARDAAARALWRKVYPRLSRDRIGLAGAILGRAEAQVMRLALLYAMMDGAGEIGMPHLRAALAVWGHVERSVAYVFGDSTGDRVADEILRALRSTVGGMTRTDLSAHFGRNLAASQLGRALELLARFGLVRVSKEPPAGDSGRPAERWVATQPDERDEGNEESREDEGLTSSNSSLSSPEAGSAW